MRTLYYISPQIWASRAGRRFEMARNLDALAVIFPFEVGCYADTGLPVEFVGHPFLAPDTPPRSATTPRDRCCSCREAGRRAVGLILPALAGGPPRVQPRRAGSPRRVDPLSERRHPRAARGRGAPARDPAPRGRTAVSASAVLTSSGTMSMHCALAGIPGAIVYRTDPLTYLAGRWLVRVPYLGIANILLGEPMYPEFIQGAASPRRSPASSAACAGDPRRRARTEAQSAELRAMLANPSGAQRGGLARPRCCPSDPFRARRPRPPRPRSLRASRAPGRRPTTRYRWTWPQRPSARSARIDLQRATSASRARRFFSAILARSSRL